MDDDRRVALQALADLTRLAIERGGGTAGVREPRRPRPTPGTPGRAREVSRG